MDDGTLYGRGVDFAVGLDGQARVGFSEGPENIRQSIEIILSTEPGERLLRPSFGAGLRQFLFEPNTPATHRLIEDRVVRSLERWEPRIRLESVSVVADRTERTAATVTVRYALVSTGASAGLTLSVDVGQQGA